MEVGLETGGERLAIRCALPWVANRIVEAADGSLKPAPPAVPTMHIVVDREHSRFNTQGWTRVTREAWCRAGTVVLEDVATSGFDLCVSCESGIPQFIFRWRPPQRTRVAAVLLRARARLLVRAVLLQYPVMWASSLRGRAPLHSAAMSMGDSGAALLVGASGVGKTTLVEEEVTAGGYAVGDNLSVADGSTVWGIVEPMRVDGGSGRPAPHGRREKTLQRRVPSLEPAMVVVLQRGATHRVGASTPDAAARALVASTYAAGELRRYWPVHAVLALGTGLGPPHPLVCDVATALAARLRCLAVELPHVRGVRLADVLVEQGAGLWM